VTDMDGEPDAHVLAARAAAEQRTKRAEEQMWLYSVCAIVAATLVGFVYGALWQLEQSQSDLRSLYRDCYHAGAP